LELDGGPNRGSSRLTQAVVLMRIFSRRRSASPAVDVSGYSLLHASLTITGDLATTGSIRIDGRLEGSVLKADSVVLGVGASISGDVHAREVVLGGTLSGNVHASERVELQSTAVVTGDVHTLSVLVQEGGIVNGRVLMTQREPAAQTSSRSRVQATPELAGR
jgi:cytoskeletal protein CcmA (bactofilin family)